MMDKDKNVGGVKQRRKKQQHFLQLEIEHMEKFNEGSEFQSLTLQQDEGVLCVKCGV